MRINTFLGAFALVTGGLAIPASAQLPAQAAEIPPAETFAQIQNLLDTSVRDGRIPSGLAMIARDDHIVWLGTAGDMGPEVPMRADAIIPLASVGKMFTATAAMILVERQMIDLEDPVSRYIPEFADLQVEVADENGQTRLVAAERPVTIRHLLTHTGGIRMNGDDFWAAWDANVGNTTTTDMARALAALPLDAQPGTRFSYGPTGASYEVLGAVIEIASGQTLEAFMQDNIFDPLGLEDTYFYLPEGKLDRLPAFYSAADGVLTLDTPYAVDEPRSAYFNGGGGVASSPEDILRFAQIFLNGGAVEGIRILEPENVQMMMTSQLGNITAFGGALSWGFGAAVRQTPEQRAAGEAGQYGWVGGGYAKLWVDPQRRLTAYIAFPIRPPGDNALLDEFERAVYTALAGQGS